MSWNWSNVRTGWNLKIYKDWFIAVYCKLEMFKILMISHLPFTPLFKTLPPCLYFHHATSNIIPTLESLFQRYSSNSFLKSTVNLLFHFFFCLFKSQKRYTLIFFSRDFDRYVDWPWCLGRSVFCVFWRNSFYLQLWFAAVVLFSTFFLVFQGISVCTLSKV